MKGCGTHWNWVWVKFRILFHCCWLRRFVPFFFKFLSPWQWSSILEKNFLFVSMLEAICRHIYFLDKNLICLNARSNEGHFKSMLIYYMLALCSSNYFLVSIECRWLYADFWNYRWSKESKVSTRPFWRRGWEGCTISSSAGHICIRFY